MGNASDSISWKKIISVGIDNAVKNMGTKALAGENKVPIPQNKQVKFITVRGEVHDVQATIIPGVKVSVKNSRNYVVTNEKGVYTIRAKTGDVLVFSARGYVTGQVIVGNDPAISVKLKLE